MFHSKFEFLNFVKCTSLISIPVRIHTVTFLNLVHNYANHTNKLHQHQVIGGNGKFVEHFEWFCAVFTIETYSNGSIYLYIHGYSMDSLSSANAFFLLLKLRYFPTDVVPFALQPFNFFSLSLFLSILHRHYSFVSNSVVCVFFPLASMCQFIPEYLI